MIGFIELPASSRGIRSLRDRWDRRCKVFSYSREIRASVSGGPPGKCKVHLGREPGEQITKKISGIVLAVGEGRGGRSVSTNPL